MTVINHSIAYGGGNVIKLGIYVEFVNSMHRSQFQLNQSSYLKFEGMTPVM